MNICESRLRLLTRIRGDLKSQQLAKNMSLCFDSWFSPNAEQPLAALQKELAVGDRWRCRAAVAEIVGGQYLELRTCLHHVGLAGTGKVDLPIRCCYRAR